MPKRSTAVAATLAGALALGLAMVPAGANAAQVQACANVQVPTPATKVWYDFNHTQLSDATLASYVDSTAAGIVNVTKGLTTSSSDDDIDQASDAVSTLLLNLQVKTEVLYFPAFGAEYQVLADLTASGASTSDIDAANTLFTNAMTTLNTAGSAYTDALSDYTDALNDQLTTPGPLAAPVTVPSSTVLHATAVDIQNAVVNFLKTGSDKVVLQTVNQCTTLTVPDVAVTSGSTTFGKASSVAASVSLNGAPQSGVATVLLDGQLLGTPQFAGSTTIALPATLAVGAHYVTVAYNSSQGAAPSVATGMVTVTKAATSASVKLNHSSVKKGKSAKATVTVAAPGTALVPSGKVTVYVNGKKFATKSLKAGKATVALKTSKKGTQKVTVKYATSDSFAASSSKSTSLKIK